ncbi:hypothetical protein E4U22_005558 [Claviceps purpurea]|nr:hypothetical protein E4U12_004800 [Claviceps purpurea]KAG6179315.1 hypothetical protein E4U27_003263 [Claviceps purpurea]KAG6290370.1 hypothetical protein E4U46_001847 [Claviceps purpurea]KAG6318265.1 hypothetical protein E4U22_005558 [Claviceps purpurea]
MDPITAGSGKPNRSADGLRPRPTFQSEIPDVPVTVERPLYSQPDDGRPLPDIGTARANMAATHDHPQGTNKNNWAERHQHQSVLQQHCEFFDRDRDGIIWPLDTFRGFYAIGFNLVLSVLAMIIIHASFSYPTMYRTMPAYLPDPFFRIYLGSIHRAKHGSDSGTYDNEGRFAPQKFEDAFAKYAGGNEYMTWGNVRSLLSGQRVFADPVGASAAFLEWAAMYYLLWPADGRMKKEDVRGIYDGSIFYDIAAARRAAKKQ